MGKTLGKSRCFGFSGIKIIQQNLVIFAIKIDLAHFGRKVASGKSKYFVLNRK